MKLKYLHVGLMVSVAMGALSTAASAEISLRMGHTYPTSHPFHVANLTMADHVSECTGGEVQIDIYPGSQLGDETSLNEQVRIGGIDIIQAAQLWSANSYPPIGVTALPYLFRDREHAISYLDSDVKQELIEGFNEETGLQMLSVAYQGAFNISSRGVAIETLEDAEGLRIRSPDTDLFMVFPPAIGAVAVPIPFPELYLALQQGVAQGSLNPIANTYSQSLYEVQDYIALTEHMVEFQGVVASGQAWERLDGEQRQCLQEGADIWARDAIDMVLALENDLRERMVAEGMLLGITQPDKEPFIEATEEARRDLMERYGWSEELVERIRAIE